MSSNIYNDYKNQRIPTFVERDALVVSKTFEQGRSESLILFGLTAVVLGRKNKDSCMSLHKHTHSATHLEYRRPGDHEFFSGGRSLCLNNLYCPTCTVAIRATSSCSGHLDPI